MTVSSPRIKLTYEDLLHFPEDGKRHELLDGAHVGTPSPGSKHQFASGNLFRILSTHAREHDLGRMMSAPFDVVLSDMDVVEPDLLLVSREHLDRIEETHLQGPPDLVIEILSESTRQRDEITKRHLYEAYGVPEYWIVDPVVKTVRVHRLGPDGRYERTAELGIEGDELLTSPTFPGLEIPLARVFE